MNRGHIAFGQTRLRAWKSRLLTSREAALLFAATTTAEVERVLAALGGSPFDKLLRIYAIAIRTRRTPLFRALLALHEIENVKLAWRVVAHDRDRALVAKLWLDFGPLATVSMPRALASLRELTDGLAKTPYGVIARSVLRTPPEGELAFDRWASQRVLDAARALPAHESLARRLAELVVRERDAQIVGRGERWYGLSPSAVAAAALLDTKPADPAELRRERLRLCQRAFTGDPFLLAQPLATVLLAEEEVRTVRSAVERVGA